MTAKPQASEGIPPGAPTSSSVDLEALGIYRTKSLKSSGKARVILVGRPKIGKTVALASAPDALFLNADGSDAMTPVDTLTSHDPLVFDVRSPKTFEQGIAHAEKLVKAGVVRSVVLDTLTLLADNVLDVLRQQGFQGFDLWREFDSVMRGGLKRLTSLDAHVFMSCHIAFDDECGEGLVPMYPGQGRRKIMALFNDFVLMSLENERRVFVLGPQGQWRGDGRNIRKKHMIDASVPKLLEELGLT